MTTIQILKREKEANQDLVISLEEALEQAKKGEFVAGFILLAGRNFQVLTVDVPPPKEDRTIVPKDRFAILCALIAGTRSLQVNLDHHYLQYSTGNSEEIEELVDDDD